MLTFKEYLEYNNEELYNEINWEKIKKLGATTALGASFFGGHNTAIGDEPQSASIVANRNLVKLNNIQGDINKINQEIKSLISIRDPNPNKERTERINSLNQKRNNLINIIKRDFPEEYAKNPIPLARMLSFEEPTTTNKPNKSVEQQDPNEDLEFSPTISDVGPNRIKVNSSVWHDNIKQRMDDVYPIHQLSKKIESILKIRSQDEEGQKKQRLIVDPLIKELNRLCTEVEAKYPEVFKNDYNLTGEKNKHSRTIFKISNMNVYSEKEWRAIDLLQRQDSKRYKKDLH